ncbi:IucA/IucC family protein [Prauserella muralis]|uniref:Siderophore biosynthesis protein n=1 Tax=Prauserella muralis TaxID=588067 RepID=A0A2V4B774_9PSEU|nr:IucA/IucC family protein [Prauserella muralis]PXY31077.1 siderophore biosynthesis protein [Prauserella muralis]TWE14642.1 siderophore synthetase component [Prauserella muralis]
MNHDLVQRALTGPGFEAVRRRVIHQLVESLLYEGVLSVEAARAAGYAITARRRATFDRITVDAVTRDGAEPESVTRFLTDVAGALDADPACLTRFARELEETVLKDALAQHVRRGALAGLDFDTLEGAITDGHRYHPAYKSRIGFDIDDNLAYGPEFARPVRPLWLAAHHSITEVTGAGEQALTPLTPPPGYTAIPVHPWQWTNHVARAFATQLRTGELVVLGEDPHTFTAQQSIRTLSCVDDPARPYLKLAMSLVNTSTSRVLAPHTVHNAPLISGWLKGIADKDPFLRDELRTVLLGEVRGTVVTPPPDLLGQDTYGALACIWRESLPPRLEDGERAVPFTGLTAREPDGTPLIDPWVSTHGLNRWVRRLVTAAVVPVVHLLCAHGIALEAHAQNMVLLHRQGLPTRVALRDFHDGVRFSRSRLAEPELCPPLRGTPPQHQNRNSFVETDDPGLVADFMLDAHLFVNVGELAIFLADAYGLAERDFWDLVRGGVESYLDRFPNPRFDVRKPAVAVEKLTTRRLLPDTELRLHDAPNPLARHA